MQTSVTKVIYSYITVRGGLAPNLGPGSIHRERGPENEIKFMGIPKVVSCTTFLYWLEGLLEYCY